MGLFIVGATVITLATPSADQTLPFSGNGTKNLRAFRLTAPSTMSWTNSGAFFQTVNAGTSNNGTVNSQGHRGTSYYPPDRYRLQVNAIGSWTITIRTGVERLGTPIRFRGNGAKALPPFRLARAKTMYWTNSGALFQTFPGGRSVSLGGVVNSRAPSGTSRLPAGRYELFVNAEGNWTIVLR